ncbi:hypothetical protein PFISCL1PPCAC_9734 [Pristionchus fissidentatus]|uniref:Uncharacterized protein n=1 Tax=Pristionchus fissidentatus TaxID=1538716 RepID=A0AAV5VI74_9BILA|nr:hypothetical protein PFISCL1PPCAC_9734 [Pristionchus fissidentatus]
MPCIRVDNVVETAMVTTAIKMEEADTVAEDAELVTVQEPTSVVKTEETTETEDDEMATVEETTVPLDAETTVVVEPAEKVTVTKRDEDTTVVAAAETDTVAEAVTVPEKADSESEEEEVEEIRVGVAEMEMATIDGEPTTIVQSRAVAVPESTYDKVFSSINDVVATLVASMATLVVSSESPREGTGVMDWAQKALHQIGCKTAMLLSGVQHSPTGSPLSSLVFGRLGEDERKKTLLVFGRLEQEKYNSNPFKSSQGHGTADYQASIVAWVSAIATMQAADVELPVNLKFLFEDKEAAEDLETMALADRCAHFLSHIDYICVADNHWLEPALKPEPNNGLRSVSVLSALLKKLNLSGGEEGGKKNDHSEAASRACKRVFGQDYCSGEAAISIVFQGQHDGDIVALLIGQRDANGNTQNEMITRASCIKGTQLLVSYLLELGNQ